MLGWPWFRAKAPIGPWSAPVGSLTGEETIAVLPSSSPARITLEALARFKSGAVLAEDGPDVFDGEGFSFKEGDPPWYVNLPAFRCPSGVARSSGGGINYYDGPRPPPPWAVDHYVWVDPWKGK